MTNKKQPFWITGVNPITMKKEDSLQDHKKNKKFKTKTNDKVIYQTT